MYGVHYFNRSMQSGQGAQKRLRQYRIEGYGPRPQARSRLARAAVVPPPSSRSGTACHCAGQHSSSLGTFSKWAILNRFPKFNTLRVEIFRMFFIRSSLPMTLMNREKFHGNRSARFPESGTHIHTHTHGQPRQLYIYTDATACGSRNIGLAG